MFKPRSKTVKTGWVQTMVATNANKVQRCLRTVIIKILIQIQSASASNLDLSLDGIEISTWFSISGSKVVCYGRVSAFYLATYTYYVWNSNLKWKELWDVNYIGCNFGYRLIIFISRIVMLVAILFEDVVMPLDKKVYTTETCMYKHSFFLTNANNKKRHKSLLKLKLFLDIRYLF